MIKTGERYFVTLANNKNLDGYVVVSDVTGQDAFVRDSKGTLSCFDLSRVKFSKVDEKTPLNKWHARELAKANKELIKTLKIVEGGRYLVSNAKSLPLSAFEGEVIVATSLDGLKKSISFVVDEGDLAELNEYLIEVPSSNCIGLVETIEDAQDEEMVDAVPLFAAAVRRGEVKTVAMVYENFRYKTDGIDGLGIFKQHMERRGLEVGEYVLNSTPAYYNETGFLYQPKYAWQGRVEIENASKELFAELSRFIKASRLNLRRDNSLNCHSNRLYRTFVRIQQLSISKAA